MNDIIVQAQTKGAVMPNAGYVAYEAPKIVLPT